MTNNPLYCYITVGDHQWEISAFPMDSPATIDALFEWLVKTYGVRRIYWRGEQERIWLQNYEFRRENVWYSRGWSWLRYLNETVGTNDLALAAAKRYGVELYAVEGLFEHAAQADVGVQVFPYPNEDRLRLEHPEWISVDRWGEQVAPGPIEFCYPEARQVLVDRFAHHVNDYGYDGIAFYTYVENFGLHYAEEYGFNEPIVREFKRRYGVDIRTEPFDKDAWARLRGEYVTQFLRELHAALAAKGKRLSMTLNGRQPYLPQPWFAGKAGLPGAGMVHLDWETWVREGIVDELFGWFWDPEDSELLAQLQEICKEKPAERIARGNHTEPKWKPYSEAGVILVNSPWYPGMTRFAFGPASLDDLKSPDWRLRAQAVLGIAEGAIKVDSATTAALASDPAVLVRREVMRTLATLGATDQVTVIEAGLYDPEPSVRIAAANALAKVGGPEVPRRLLAAIERDEINFQLREAALAALQRRLDEAEPDLIEGTRSPSLAVREVCVRALEKSAPDHAQAALLSALREDADYRIRFWATRSLSSRYSPQTIRALLAALDDPEPAVELGAARALGDLASAMSEEEASQVLAALDRLFRQYGDGCQRADAAWGWRTIGNAIAAFGTAGKAALESMCSQKGDKWLAWAAYLVLHVPQATDHYILYEEQHAVETHRQYAPPFPGRRQ